MFFLSLAFFFILAYFRTFVKCFTISKHNKDEKRVLVQSRMISALGMSRGSSAGRGGDRLAKFVAGKRLTSFISPELLGVTENPKLIILIHPLLLLPVPFRMLYAKVVMSTSDGFAYQPNLCFLPQGQALPQFPVSEYPIL